MSTDVPIRILVVDDSDGAAKLLGVKHHFAVPDEQVGNQETEAEAS